MKYKKFTSSISTTEEEEKGMNGEDFIYLFDSMFSFLSLMMTVDEGRG